MKLTSEEFKRLKFKKPRKYNESKLQQECFAKFKMFYPKYTYIYKDEKGKYHTGCLLVKNCNEGNKSDVKRMIEYKEGLQPGLADMSLKIKSPIFGYIGLEIEFKSKIGSLSKAQATYKTACEAQGYNYVIIRSVEEFLKEIKKYLEK